MWRSVDVDVDEDVGVDVDMDMEAKTLFLSYCSSEDNEKDRKQRYSLRLWASPHFFCY